MRTSDFINAVEKVKQLLALDEFLSVLIPIMDAPGNPRVLDGQKEKFSAAVHRATVGFTEAAADPHMSRVLSVMELGDTVNWTQLSRLLTVMNHASNNSEITQGPLAAGFWNLAATARATAALAQHLRGVLFEGRREAIGAGEVLVEVAVIDFDGDGLPVERVTEVFGRLSRLHAAVAGYLDADSQLRLAYTESGSDVTLGLIMGEAAAEAIKSLFRDGLRYLRFWKEDGFDRRMESLNRGLDFITKVRKQTEEGDIEPETARRLEHAVTKEMIGLLGDGVALHEELPPETVPGRELLVGLRSLRQLNPGTQDTGGEPDEEQP